MASRGARGGVSTEPRRKQLPWLVKPESQQSAAPTNVDTTEDGMAKTSRRLDKYNSPRRVSRTLPEQVTDANVSGAAQYPAPTKTTAVQAQSEGQGTSRLRRPPRPESRCMPPTSGKGPMLQDDPSPFTNAAVHDVSDEPDEHGSTSSSLSDKVDAFISELQEQQENPTVSSRHSLRERRSDSAMRKVHLSNNREGPHAAYNNGGRSSLSVRKDAFESSEEAVSFGINYPLESDRRRRIEQDLPKAQSPSPPFTRTARPSLHQIPSHLLAMSTSSSSSQNDTSYTSSISTIARLESRPDNKTGSLSRAVTGLENLMDEALSVAKDAARTGRSEEVAKVLNNATLALRKASMTGDSLGQPSEGLTLRPRPSPGLKRDSVTSGVLMQSAAGYPSTNSQILSAPSTLPSPSSIAVQGQVRTVQAKKSQQALVEKDISSDSSSSHEVDSISPTPPLFYKKTSLGPAVRDFAYTDQKPERNRAKVPLSSSEETDGASSESHDDIQPSGVSDPINRDHAVSSGQGLFDRHQLARPRSLESHSPFTQDSDSSDNPQEGKRTRSLRLVEPEPLDPLDDAYDPKSRRMSSTSAKRSRLPGNPRRSSKLQHADSALQRPEESGRLNARQARRYSRASSHHAPPTDEVSGVIRDGRNAKRASGAAIEPQDRYDSRPPNAFNEDEKSKRKRYSDPTLALQNQDLSLKHPRRKHLNLYPDQGFSLGRHHKRRPIAREWSSCRKRITATITCLNTVFIGLIAGVYAGEVPRIQYQIADQGHLVLYGNVLLFAGLSITTIVFWPLPLLHGRKPYILMAFALLLPLQFPQALAINSFRDPGTPIYRVGLLFPRAIAGLALGFANINFLPTLFDLFGASLMSKRPHQEIVVYDDVRRQGGGMGIWLGIWTFCFSSALSIGFCIGACIIARLDPAWGFYMIVILLAFFLLINVISPETRRSPYRRSIAHFFDEDEPEKLKRRVARGEVKLHISNDGPKWWFQEVWAGILLTSSMIKQPGYFVLMVYMAWIKAQLTLVILLLGALLSRDYRWRSQYVGLAALAVPFGAFLALPMTKASWFSRSRSTPPRTDSMTFQPRLTWTSHLVRRLLFSFMLPFAGVAFCLTAAGPPLNWTAPVIFSALVAFLTDLGIAECVGLIMETFDTSDLQPGVNTRHRLQSMSAAARRRRTNYTSFPRVCAGFFAADALGFLLSAVATGVAGAATRAYGAQTALAIVAAVLLLVTLLLLAALWRRADVQVVPSYTAATTFHGSAWWSGPGVSDPAWKPVIVGNPSGKMRRMNSLELGSWSRWTEIRKLNGLIRE